MSNHSRNNKNSESPYPSHPYVDGVDDDYDATTRDAAHANPTSIALSSEDFLLKAGDASSSSVTGAGNDAEIAKSNDGAVNKQDGGKKKAAASSDQVSQEMIPDENEKETTSTSSKKRSKKSRRKVKAQRTRDAVASTDKEKQSANMQTVLADQEDHHSTLGSNRDERRPPTSNGTLVAEAHQHQDENYRPAVASDGLQDRPGDEDRSGDEDRPGDVRRPPTDPLLSQGTADHQDKKGRPGTRDKRLPTAALLAAQESVDKKLRPVEGGTRRPTAGLLKTQESVSKQRVTGQGGTRRSPTRRLAAEEESADQKRQPAAQGGTRRPPANLLAKQDSAAKKRLSTQAGTRRSPAAMANGISGQESRRGHPESPRKPDIDDDDRFKINQQKRVSRVDSVAGEKRRPRQHFPLLQADALAQPTEALSRRDYESSQDEDEPVCLGIGIPESTFSRAPSSGARGGVEETKEEMRQTAPRRKNSNERNREVIDGLLAANVGTNQANKKDGKKCLPENVNAEDLVRRQSGRNCAAKQFSQHKSSEFSIGSNHTPTSPYCPPPPARDESSASQSFGNQLTGSDLSQQNETMVAHSGLQSGAMPGAYSVPGTALERQDSTYSDLSDYHPELFQDEARPVGNATRDSASTGDTLMRSTTDEGTRDIERQAQGPVLTGEIVGEDGFTEEELAERKWKKKRWKIALCFFVLSVVAFVVTAIFRDRGASSGASNADGVWEPLGETLTGPSTDDDLFFGNSVSVSGDGTRFATGLPGIDRGNSDNDVGQVQIFDLERVSEQWNLGETIDFEEREGRAGRVVSLSSDGRRIAVGSPAWSNEIGLISMFEDIGNNEWQQVGENIGGRDSDGAKGRFGNVVAMSADGRIVAAAAPFANSQYASEGGVVRIYREENSEWKQMGAEIVSQRDRALLGISIALSANGMRLAVGATNFDTQVDVQVVGQVRIYDFDGQDWIEMPTTLDGVSEFETFGNAVTLNAAGNLLAVGANGSPGADSRVNSGKVQVFELVDTSWVQIGEDILGRRSENLGASLALSNDGILVVGSPTYREAGKETGQVKVYAYSAATGWRQIANAINGSGEGETFGISVAISSDGTVIGAGAPKAGFDGGRVQEVGNVRMYHNEKMPKSIK